MRTYDMYKAYVVRSDNLCHQMIDTACSYIKFFPNKITKNLLILTIPLIIISQFMLSTEVKAASGKVTAVKGQGYGRMVFEFDRLPKYTYDISGTILVLKFSEKVNVNVGLVTEKLDAYIGVARRDPDGRALRFAMTDVFKVNLNAVGTKLFLDILPTSWTGQPPALPKDVLDELTRAAEEAAAIAAEEAKQLEESRKKNKLIVRVAIHPTFSRLLFDWNKFATVKMSRKGDKVSIKFGRYANVDLSQLKADPPPYLRKVALIKNDKGIEIELLLNPEANIRGFREGIDYVVDITGPYSDLDLSSEEAKKKIAERYNMKKLVDEEGNGDGKIPPQELKAANDKETYNNENSKRKSKKLLDVPISVKSILFIPENITRPELGDLESTFGSDGEGFSYNQVWRGADKPGDIKRKKVAKERAEKKASKTKNNKNITRKKKNNNDSNAELSDKELTVQVKKVGDRLELSFPFKRPIATAIYQRGRTLTIVLETDQKINTRMIKKMSKGMVKDVSLENISGAQVLNIQLAKKWLAYANLSNSIWNIAIGDMVSGDLTPLRVKRVLRNDKRIIMAVRYENPGHVYTIKDKEIGDELIVVTGFGPTRGFVKTQKFVENQILASSNGIVIKPIAEDLSVRLRVNEVLISRKKGLTISSDNVYRYLIKNKLKKPKKKSLLGFVDFKNWQKGGKKFFSRRAEQLERAVAFADEKEKNKKRLELARFYLAHMLAAESLGVTKQIIDTDATAANDPSLNLIHGVASAIMKRNLDAKKSLNKHEIAFDKNAALWRGYLAVNEKNWPIALKQFSEGKEEIPSYPQDLQTKFLLMDAKAALSMKQWKRAAESLNAISEDTLSKNNATELSLLRGRYYQTIGKNDEAISSYKKVISADAGAPSAEAELRKIGLQLKDKKINISQAIKKLERLSIIWRGDEIELRALHKLANLYAQNKKYRKAFEVMKNTVIAFPKEREALQIQDEMKEVFSDLFLYGKADNLPPVRALSLYYDYKELTPIGRLGDELIRRLAGRLMDVDLLDQASELLDYQVKNRLNGIARAQVAARLALVHLMNRKPSLALRTIRDTRQPDLPDGLKKRRDILEARSLGELGRVENTIDILGRLKGYDIARLKADAFWKAHRWQRAGELLEEMLGTRWKDENPLSDTERFDILRAAISYSLAEDQFALDRLRKKYYEKMKYGQDAESFVLVTSPVLKRGPEFTKLAKEISNVDTLEAFIKEYQARFDKIDGKEKSASRNQEPEKNNS